jgi:hydrogenase expression/formation protein HypC
MCLAIPSKIVEIENSMAIIDVEGVRRKASLLLLEDVAVGDYVIVHAGYAINKLDAAAARESLELLREAFFKAEDHQSNIPKNTETAACPENSSTGSTRWRKKKSGSWKSAAPTRCLFSEAASGRFCRKPYRCFPGRDARSA